MPWTLVGFGKHRGKTLPQIVLKDPDWFFWAIEKKVFDSKTPALKMEAEEIHRKATKIRIRGKEASKLKVEYVIHSGVGKLAGVRVVPAVQLLHDLSGPTFHIDHFDLSFPRKMAPYDKMGGKIIVDAVKYYVFGNGSARLTRERCESFFDDDTNFG